jgi:hypothetical protein
VSCGNPRLRLCSAAGRELLSLPLRASTLRAQHGYLQLLVFALLVFVVGGLSFAVPAALISQRCWPPPAPPSRIRLLPQRRLWAGQRLLVWPDGPGRWQALYADELSARDFHRLRRLLIRLARSGDAVALEPIDFYRL